MTWLLKLYPPRWRRRYGPELTALIAAQPFSIAAAIDLLAGAIDAWFHPRMVQPTPEMKGDVPMIARIMQLKCAGYGPTVTPTDRRKNTTINIGGTLVLALAWLALVWVWKDRHFTGNGYLMALAPMTYVIPYLVGLRYTSLKGRSLSAQTTLIVGLSAALTTFLLVVGWVTTKI
jgi:hypothetical protein